MTPTMFEERRVGTVRFSATLLGLVLLLSGWEARGADIIFTIDPSQSQFSSAVTDDVFGAHVAQSAGSLAAPLQGHFLVRFDPFSGTPSTLEVVAGDGYFQPTSPHLASPGPGGGLPAAANTAGQTAGGELLWAIRDLSWDFFTPAPLNGTLGEFPGGETSFNVLSGGIDLQASDWFDHSDYFPFTDQVTAGTWTVSESAPHSGDWTLAFTGHYTYESHITDVGSEPLLTATITHTGSLVSTAHFGSANVDEVASGGTQGQALGGAATTGGVSAEFSEPTGGGTLSVQQVPNETGLSQAAVAAAEANPIFALSTSTLSADPQIWNVDFSGSLNGGNVTLLFHYDPSLLPVGFDELTLGIWHFNSNTNAWEFGGIVDPDADTVAYTTDNFSPFELGVSVPEPSTLVLAGLGLLCLAFWARRRAR